MKVKCKVCQKEFYLINMSHLGKHGITSTKEYRDKYPGAEIFSEDYRNKRSKSASEQFYNSWNKDYFGMYKRMHNKEVVNRRRNTLIKTLNNKKLNKV